MSEETRTLVTFVIATTLGLATLIGLAVKFVLLPYLEKHFKQPVAAVQEQVQNSHTTNLRHDIDDLRDTGLKTGQAVARIEGILIATREQDAGTHRDLWSAVNELRRRDT